jgi:hypothetical protein
MAPCALARASLNAVAALDVVVGAVAEALAAAAAAGSVTPCCQATI